MILFIAAAAVLGIFIDISYAWKASFVSAQATGQHTVNLFLIVPATIISLSLINKGNKNIPELYNPS